MRITVLVCFLAVFVDLAANFDLSCTSKFGEWIYLGNITFCKVTSLTLTSPNEEITSVNGDTTPTTFQGLNIASQTVHYMPKGIGKFFPHLRGLSVFSSGLKSIQAADFESLIDLESLSIYYNPIEELPGDLFKFTPKITDFYFANNQISRVGKDLLKNVHSFKRIDFNYNKCINLVVYLNFTAMENELRTKCPYPGEEDRKNEITTL